MTSSNAIMPGGGAHIVFLLFSRDYRDGSGWSYSEWARVSRVFVVFDRWGEREKILWTRKIN